MKLLWAHVKVDLLSLQRRPMSVFPGLLAPGLLFLFIGVPNARDQTAANWFMTAMTVFAVLGITFFQFGVAIAAARGSPWELTLRTLPLAPGVRFAARVLVALVMALAAVGLMVSLALLLTPAGLAFAGWLRWGLALLLGSIPLALLGIALGYWARPTAAAPVANLLYMVLAYAGGLWTLPSQLPDLVAQISPYLPTRRYAEVVWAPVRGRVWPVEDWLWLLGYTAAFGALAIWGYQRDEGERFR
jgi:ABC-2 type transport system permease protein